jgi:hypothetical protein
MLSSSNHISRLLVGSSKTIKLVFVDSLLSMQH